MHSVTIPVHSFIDVITNSSSETFVTAGDKTVETFKSLLKLFLESAGQPHEVDEVFDVQLVYKDWDDAGHEIEKVGTSDYRPSYVRVTVKDSHKENYGALVKVMNQLNTSFWSQEYYS